MLRTICSILIASTLIGCAASNRIEGVTAVRAPSGPPVSSNVVVNSSALDGKLQFGDVASRRAGLLLQVQVAVENVSSSTVAFEYRWEWTDAEGFQLGDTLSTWTPSIVNGGERKLLAGVGPGPAAANFRLYIRQPSS